MKIFCFSIFAVILLFSQMAFADCSVNNTLRVGSTGAEVQCLQTKLGVAVDGSFGPLTRMAVMYFQSNKKLVTDGIVGPLSRIALNSVVADNNIYPTGCTSFLGYSSTTGIKCDGSSNPPTLPPTDKSANVISPNLINLDQFINTVVEINKKNGSSDKELDLIADAIRTTALNSGVDYNKKFKELLINESKISFFDKIVSKTLSFLGIVPSSAEAASLVGIPFDGAVVLPIPCTASGGTMWMVGIASFPPSAVPSNVIVSLVLTYIEGTQAFASYNIPYTAWLVGTYQTPGVCPMYAGVTVVNINTEGTILPMTGSSPL